MFGGYCYVDVVVIVVDYVVIVDGGVYFWELFQCFYIGVGKEVYEIKMDIVGFFEGVFVVFVYIYDWFYVDFVEGG